MVAIALPVLIFGDACCEPHLHGVGAILVDPVVGVCQAFGRATWPAVSSEFERLTGASQIVGQLELLPILMALWLWAPSFAEAGRRCLFFIENGTARFGLIRGYSPRRGP